MSLPEAVRKSLEQSRELTRVEIHSLDSKIEEELAKVKERLASIQEQKKKLRDAYDSLCTTLGVESEFAKDDE